MLEMTLTLLFVPFLSSTQLEVYKLRIRACIQIYVVFSRFLCHENRPVSVLLAGSKSGQSASEVISCPGAIGVCFSHDILFMFILIVFRDGNYFEDHASNLYFGFQICFLSYSATC